MFAVTLIFAIGLHWATGSPLALLLLALIPGGFPEMSLIALGMGFDPAFVVTHHGFRVLLVVTFALPLYSWLARSGWFERHWPASPKRNVSTTVRMLSRAPAPADEARANRLRPRRESRCEGRPP